MKQIRIFMFAMTLLLTACGSSNSDNGSKPAPPSGPQNPPQKVIGPGGKAKPEIGPEHCKGAPESTLVGVWLSRFNTDTMSNTWVMDFSEPKIIHLHAACYYLDQNKDYLDKDVVYKEIGDKKLQIVEGGAVYVEHGNDECEIGILVDYVANYHFEGSCLVWDFGYGPWYFVRHL